MLHAEYSEYVVAPIYTVKTYICVLYAQKYVLKLARRSRVMCFDVFAPAIGY